MPELADARRCIAIDLPLHGRSPLASNQQLGLPAFARFLKAVCDEMGVTEVDLVAHDTGGAIAQVFAARHPSMIRTLTLTNCETQDNLPPKSFKPVMWMARAGLLERIGPRLLRDAARARRRVFRMTYEDVEALPLPIARSFLEPVLGTRERARAFQRWVLSLRAADLRAVESELRQLAAPALLLWGTGDITFDIRWARWLRDVLPGANEIVELAGARLFFPDERAGELVPHLRRHWGLDAADERGAAA
jgi:pimeloyl-ACP methyl ester carboxylesterase